MVRVEGVALNHQQDTHLIIHSTADCSSWNYDQSSTWDLETPANVPFDLIAVDGTLNMSSTWEYDRALLQWARVSCDGLDSFAVIDIDFAAHAVAPSVIEGTFGLPARDNSPLHGSTGHPFLYSSVKNSFWTGVVGFPSIVRLRDGTVEYTIELIETPEYGGISYL